jgi:hypothetical protein
VLTLFRDLRASNDKGEVEEGKKDDIEFVEAREDATKALEPAEQPLDFIAPAIARKAGRDCVQPNSDLEAALRAVKPRSMPAI